MVSLTGTFTAVGVLSAGLWAVCASVFATAGWTAPACLAAGFSSGIGLILGIVNDATSQTSTSSNNPDSKRSAADTVKWFKLHDDGFMENYDGRLRELYGTNETHTIMDTVRGYTHTVSTNRHGNTQVRTDFTQGFAKRGVSLRSRSQTFRRGLAGLVGKREGASQEASNTLSSAVYSAQNIGGDVGGDSTANEDTLGSQLADSCTSLGTWCMSINDGDTVVADVGLTLGGSGYEPSDDEPPCESS